MTRQPERPENFAWVEENVLVLGINLVGAPVLSDPDWDQRLDDDATWVEDQLASAPSWVYAAVVFGHSHPNDHPAFRDRFVDAATEFGSPVLYLQGDGHVWIHDQPWIGPIDRVQVDAGGSAPRFRSRSGPRATPCFNSIRIHFRRCRLLLGTGKLNNNVSA